MMVKAINYSPECFAPTALIALAVAINKIREISVIRLIRDSDF